MRRRHRNALFIGRQPSQGSYHVIKQLMKFEQHFQLSLIDLTQDMRFCQSQTEKLSSWFKHSLHLMIMQLMLLIMLYEDAEHNLKACDRW